MKPHQSSSTSNPVGQKPGVVFAVPCYGGQVTEGFFTSFFQLQHLFYNQGMLLTVRTIVNDSLVTRARNNLVAFFMDVPGATHLMFIDADIRFDPMSVIKLLNHDLDVVAGTYPSKSINWDRVKEGASTSKAEQLKYFGSRYVVNRQADQEVRGDLVEVTETGTGFMLIKKQVIEKMFQSYPELKLSHCQGMDPKLNPYLYTLFDTSIDESRTYLSEDYTFCRRWRKLGGKVWIDRSINLEHIGTYSFSGNPEAISANIEVNKKRSPESTSTLQDKFS